MSAKKTLTFLLCAAMILAFAVPVAAFTEIGAPKTATPIVIDGVRDDSYGDMVEIKAMQDGTPGATAKMWPAWDDDYIYYYFEVSDKTPNHSSDSNWGRDCIEMFFDWYNGADEDTSDMAHPYWQYRIASAAAPDYPTDMEPNGEQFSNGINQAAGEDGTGWSVADHVNTLKENSFVKLVDGGYIVETKIAYKKFGIKLSEGATVSVDFMIGDNQEGETRNSCAWLDAAYSSNDQWQYPNTVGGKLKLLGVPAAPEPEPAPAPEPAAPAPAPEPAAPAPAPAAPVTGDNGLALAVFAILAGAAFAVSKNRKHLAK